MNHNLNSQQFRHALNQGKALHESWLTQQPYVSSNPEGDLFVTHGWHDPQSGGVTHRVSHTSHTTRGIEDVDLRTSGDDPYGDADFSERYADMDPRGHQPFGPRPSPN